MRKPRSIQEVLLPMTILSWIMGCGVIEYPLGHPQYVISFLYTSFILVGYIILSYYSKISDNYLYLKNVNNTGKSVIKIIIWGSGLQALSAIILCWKRRKVNTK